MDERSRQACVGNQRNVVVDCRAADLEAVGNLTGGMVARDIHHQVECFVRDQTQYVYRLEFVGATDSNGVYARFL